MNEDTTNTPVIKATEPVDVGLLAPNKDLKFRQQPTPDTGVVQPVINGVIEANRAARQNAAQQEIDTLKTEKDKNKRDLQVLSSQLGDTSQFKEEAYKDAGVDVAQKKFDQYTSQIEAEQLAARRKVEKLQKNETGMSSSAIADESNRILRESESRQADLALLQTAALREYDTARSIADRQVELRIAPIKQKLDTVRFLYEDNREDLSEKEKTLLQQKINDEERKLEDAKENARKIESIKLIAAKNGATQDVLFNMSNAETFDEALQAASKYMSDPSSDVVRLENGNTVVIDKRSGKIINNLGGSKPDGTPVTDADVLEYDALVSTVSNLENTVSGKKAVATQLNSILQRGDYVSAYNQIANTVASSLTGDTKTRFENARIDREVLAGLRQSVEEFQLAGGDTGLLKGSAEEINRKLGRVTDPKLTALAVTLQREFQAYRNAMTGAAFSPSESREYSSVNPTASKSLDLNLAVIDGALDQLNNRVDGTIKAKVPQASNIKSLIEPKQKSDNAKLKVDTVYATGDDVVRSTIESLFDKGKDDADVIEYLQLKGLIPST